MTLRDHVLVSNMLRPLKQLIEKEVVFEFCLCLGLDQDVLVQLLLKVEVGVC